MKKIIPIIILSLLSIILMPGCRRVSHNGKIDGYWQIREIYYTATGEIQNPKNKFICINLELMQLNYPNPSPELTGVLAYHKGDDAIGVDFRYGPSAELLAQFGFAPTPDNPNFCTLDIKRVDSKNLVLESPIATITCKKF